MDIENDKEVLIPVEGHNNFFRDRYTGAILNNDNSAYLHYMKMKEQKQREKDELDQLKRDIVEIKELLKEITNGSRQN